MKSHIFIFVISVFSLLIFYERFGRRWYRIRKYFSKFIGECKGRFDGDVESLVKDGTLDAHQCVKIFFGLLSTTLEIFNQQDIFWMDPHLGNIGYLTVKGVRSFGILDYGISTSLSKTDSRNNFFRPLIGNLDYCRAVSRNECYKDVFEEIYELARGSLNVTIKKDQLSVISRMKGIFDRELPSKCSSDDLFNVWEFGGKEKIFWEVRQKRIYKLESENNEQNRRISQQDGRISQLKEENNELKEESNEQNRRISQLEKNEQNKHDGNSNKKTVETCSTD